MADLIRQDQRAEEIGKVVGQEMQLQPHGIGGEAAAGQAGPDDRVQQITNDLASISFLISEIKDYQERGQWQPFEPP